MPDEINGREPQLANTTQSTPVNGREPMLNSSRHFIQQEWVDRAFRLYALRFEKEVQQAYNFPCELCLGEEVDHE